MALPTGSPLTGASESGLSETGADSTAARTTRQQCKVFLTALSLSMRLRRFFTRPLRGGSGVHWRRLRDRSALLDFGTHNADILLKCLESVSDTSVVRLSYQARVTTARELPAEESTQLAQGPSVRFADVLQAFFHRAAVDSEADSD